MQTVGIQDFVRELGVSVPPLEEFWRLGDATGLRCDRESGGNFRSNYERGVLLYALVAQRRPATVLEYGTGRGYGALCMARAMVDQGIDGVIYTIDRLPQHLPIAWWIDWHDGQGGHSEQLSRAAVWPRVATPEQIARIRVLEGTAAGVMSRLNAPPVELAFIDGDHTYDGASHDFLSLLPHCAETVGLLFDDYEGPEQFGVDRLVGEEVSRCFTCTVVTNDGSWSAAEGRSVGHAMAWAVHTPEQGALAAVYPPAEVARRVRPYRRRQAWLACLRRLRRLLRAK